MSFPKVYVIAEIGINHNGDFLIAKELIDIAADAGANAVKFQKRTINKVYSEEFLDSIEIVLGVIHKEIKKWVWNLI